VQGADYLEKVLSQNGGEALTYAAHKAADGVWLLDREDLIIEGQLYTSRYSFDASNRITQQQVDYQNAAGCNHLISILADYVYANDALISVKLHGGYEGTQVEGDPRVDWQAVVGLTYDTSARVTKEELVVTSFNKMYNAKPYGTARDEVSRIYPSMRVKRPLENVARTGDLCGTSGTLLLGNPIDLRAFYAMSPNLAMLLPYGVTKATVSFTYPENYKVR